MRAWRQRCSRLCWEWRSRGVRGLGSTPRLLLANLQESDAKVVDQFELELEELEAMGGRRKQLIPICTQTVQHDNDYCATSSVQYLFIFLIKSQKRDSQVSRINRERKETYNWWEKDGKKVDQCLNASHPRPVLPFLQRKGRTQIASFSSNFNSSIYYAAF